MENAINPTPPPATPSLELQKQYNQLCAEIGHRHFLIEQLSAQIGQLAKKLEELHVKPLEPEPTT